MFRQLAPKIPAALWDHLFMSGGAMVEEVLNKETLGQETIVSA
jgi:hypothetical protein